MRAGHQRARPTGPQQPPVQRLAAVLPARRLEGRIQIHVGAFPQPERFAVAAEDDDGLPFEQRKCFVNVAGAAFIEDGMEQVPTGPQSCRAAIQSEQSDALDDVPGKWRSGGRHAVERVPDQAPLP